MTEIPEIGARRSGGGRKFFFVLFLVILGLCGGLMVRLLVTGGPGSAASPVGRSSSALPRDSRTIWKRLLAGLPLEKVRRFAVDHLIGRAEERRAPETPVEVHRKPEKPGSRLSQFPLLPGESEEQRAARLWQGGVLSTRQGDYSWAIQQFKACLEAQPRSDSCKAGLSEAERRLAWNRKSKR